MKDKLLFLQRMLDQSRNHKTNLGISVKTAFQETIDKMKETIQDRLTLVRDFYMTIHGKDRSLCSIMEGISVLGDVAKLVMEFVTNNQIDQLHA